MWRACLLMVLVGCGSVTVAEDTDAGQSLVFSGHPSDGRGTDGQDGRQSDATDAGSSVDLGGLSDASTDTMGVDAEPSCQDRCAVWCAKGKEGSVIGCACVGCP